MPLSLAVVITHRYKADMNEHYEECNLVRDVRIDTCVIVFNCAFIVIAVVITHRYKADMNEHYEECHLVRQM